MPCVISIQVRDKTAIPIGTLMRNTHDQSTYAVIMPPKKTPAVPPAGAAAPQKPIALFLSDGMEKRFITIERADGAMSAAPIPWRALAAIRMVPLGASPARTEA